MITTKKSEKQILLEQARLSLGFFDYWAGYQDIAYTLTQDGPYQLKQGKLVTGRTMQKTNLQRAIKNINVIKDMPLTLRYKKHSYLLQSLCEKILGVLDFSSQYVNGQLHPDEYQKWSKEKQDKVSHAFFSLDDGRKTGNVNTWAKPVTKSRRKQPNYQKAKKYMTAAVNDWLTVTTQDDDPRLIYFVSDKSVHRVSVDNIYNLLTKDFPWS